MDKLILIHGALGSEKEFEPVVSMLSQSFDVISYTFPGHSIRSQDDCDFLIESFTSDLSEFLEKIGPCYIFGFSMGGYVALNVARRNHLQIKGIVTLGTKFSWSEEMALRETANLSLDFLASKASSFLEYLNQLHGEQLPILLNTTKEFMLDLGHLSPLTPDSVSTLSTPVIILRGGKDRMVGRAESEKIAQSLPQGSYRELPFLPHPLFLISPKHLARLIQTYIGAFNYKKAKTTNGSLAYLAITPKTTTSDTVCLFLHEALGSIAQWNNFPHLLCDALEMKGVVIEMPGYGFSDDPQKKRTHRYLHEFGWEVLPSFIQELLPAEKILIIGHSDGGTEALLYAAKHPSHIQGVVTLAAHIRNESITKEGIRPALQAYEEGKLNGLQLFHGERTDKIFYDWANTWLSDDFDHWDISDDIKGIPVQGLIIQGENDQYGSPQQVTDICASFQVKAEAVLLSNCGHSPHLEQPTPTIKTITAWSKKLNT